MTKHYIIMSSSYADGNRIALDLTDPELLTGAEIQKVIQYIKETCGESVSLSTHLIETESDSWNSVTQYDPFFEEVECVKCAALGNS